MNRKLTARQQLGLRKRKGHMTRAWVSEQRDSVSRGAEMICTDLPLLPVRSSSYPARNPEKWSWQISAPASPEVKEEQRGSGFNVHEQHKPKPEPGAYEPQGVRDESWKMGFY